MRAGLFSALAIVAACSGAPSHGQADEALPEICQVLDEPGRAAAVAAAADKWGVPESLLLATMRQESHFKADKRHASTAGAYGYPQAVLGTWNHYRKETEQPSASRNSFADSMDFIAWYHSATREQTGRPYSDTIGYYLAYSRGWAAKGQASAAAKRNAAKVAAFAEDYEADLKACPIERKPEGILAFLTGAS